jgi:hypothetical protein
MLFVASLLTWPAATLAIGSVAYLAVIPYSLARYRRRERVAQPNAHAEPVRDAPLD